MFCIGICFLAISIVLGSCSKRSDSMLSDLSFILQNHQWYKDSTRVIYQVDSAGTTRRTDKTDNSSPCEKQELLFFLRDSLFETQPKCDTPDRKLAGKWDLGSDSLFFGYILIPQSPLPNYAVDTRYYVYPSKLVEIDDRHFVTWQFDRFYEIGNPQYSFDLTTITTYKSVQ